MNFVPEDTTKPTNGLDRSRRRLLAMWEGGFREIALPDQGSHDLGRSQLCQLRIDHPSVSRRHLVVYAAPFAVEDCHSSNGTRLNGVRVASGTRVPVRAGDTIEVGRVVLLFQGGPPEGGSTPPPSALSTREAEVLAHLARGLTNKEIANALNISPRTVQHHIEHIYSKLAVSTRAAATVCALHLGLVGHTAVPAPVAMGPLAAPSPAPAKPAP